MKLELNIHKSKRLGPCKKNMNNALVIYDIREIYN